MKNTFFFFSFVLWLVACHTQAPHYTVRASGSSALQPLVNAAKEKFEANNLNVSVEVSAGGSKKGLSDVLAGAVEIGNSDIESNDPNLVDNKVAMVGFAAMANQGDFNQNISSMTLKEMADVFSGHITNWRQLGGGNQPIVVINRAPASGTRAVFGNFLFGSDQFVESQTEDNSGQLVAKLKQTRGAISYLAMSFACHELVVFNFKRGNAIIAPSNDNIALNAYPIWSYEHMYTNRHPNDGTNAFLDYMLSDDFQHHVLSTVPGFVPVR